MIFFLINFSVHRFVNLLQSGVYDMKLIWGPSRLQIPNLYNQADWDNSISLLVITVNFHIHDICIIFISFKCENPTNSAHITYY